MSWRRPPGPKPEPARMNAAAVPGRRIDLAGPSPGRRQLLGSGLRAVATASVLALVALQMLGPGAQADTMRMRVTVNGKELTATLVDSPTTRDFISRLPLKLTMQDLFGREKFGHLPRGLAEGGKRVRAYDVGDVIYWSPRPRCGDLLPRRCGADSAARNHRHREDRIGHRSARCARLGRGDDGASEVEHAGRGLRA